MYSGKSGFTLVEVLVASVIGVFVALVAVGTLKAISASAEMVEDNISAAAEVRFASNMIARDLVNLYRDSEADNMKLVGAVLKQSDESVVSYLTLYTVGRVKARVGQPEGDVYEVEYFLKTSGEKSVLVRRLWPNPDRDAQPGGVLTVIAEDIDVFAVRFFDGREWQLEWPEETRSVPELVEVSIAAKPPGRADRTMETFIVNFARSGWERSGRGDEEEEGGEEEEGAAESEDSR